MADDWRVGAAGQPGLVFTTRKICRSWVYRRATYFLGAFKKNVLTKNPYQKIYRFVFITEAPFLIYRKSNRVLTFPREKRKVALTDSIERRIWRGTMGRVYFVSYFTEEAMADNTEVEFPYDHEIASPDDLNLLLALVEAKQGLPQRPVPCNLVPLRAESEAPSTDTLVPTGYFFSYTVIGGRHSYWGFGLAKALVLGPINQIQQIREVEDWILGSPESRKMRVKKVRIVYFGELPGWREQ